MQTALALVPSETPYGRANKSIRRVHSIGGCNTIQLIFWGVVIRRIMLKRYSGFEGGGFELFAYVNALFQRFCVLLLH